MGKVYNHGFTFVDVVYNEVIQDFKNIDVIAFILDKYTGQIVNAKKTHVLDGFSGVESQFSDNAEILDILYYDLTGRRVGTPSNGVFIKVCIKSDGSCESSKVIVR